MTGVDVVIIYTREGQTFLLFSSSSTIFKGQHFLREAYKYKVWLVELLANKVPVEGESFGPSACLFKLFYINIFLFHGRIVESELEKVLQYNPSNKAVENVYE